MLIRKLTRKEVELTMRIKREQQQMKLLVRRCISICIYLYIRCYPLFFPFSVSVSVHRCVCICMYMYVYIYVGRSAGQGQRQTAAATKTTGILYILLGMRIHINALLHKALGVNIVIAAEVTMPNTYYSRKIDCH